MLEGYCLVVMEEWVNSITDFNQECILGLFKGQICENCQNWVPIESYLPETEQMQ